MTLYCINKKGELCDMITKKKVIQPDNDNTLIDIICLFVLLFVMFYFI